MKGLTALLTITVGGTCAYASLPTDSVVGAAEAELYDNLQEITVTASGPRKVISLNADGSLAIDASMLDEMPSLMGSRDPLALVRSMPDVATANELDASVTVRGSSAGSNLFTADGARIFNPMHMLGLYSAYNPSYYSVFEFSAGRMPATWQNSTGGAFRAFSLGEMPDSVLSVDASVGLIESHGAIRIPLVAGRFSLQLGARRTYLNLLFPDILQLGESHIDYGFTDLNAAINWRIDDANSLRASFFGNHDAMGLNNDINGAKDGNFGWRNMSGALEWVSRRVRVMASASTFSNQFILSEGGTELNLPSAVGQYTLTALSSIGDVSMEADLSWRHSTGQEGGSVRHPSDAVEANIAADWRRPLKWGLSLEAGLRLTLYHCGELTRVYPQPRVQIAYAPRSWIGAFIAYGEYVKTDLLVRESSSGLPADFFINADRMIRPESIGAISGGVTGRIPVVGIDYSVEGYFKMLRHQIEYAGNLMLLVNQNYNPLDDVIAGHGYAAGLSVSLIRQWGRWRGRVGYAYGVARLQFAEYGDEMFPASSSRPHDLNASLSFDILRGLTLSAAFTHATGTPYTRARYGYMIGENLICDYFPHNSSRLPAYNRLDLSLNWVFSRSRSIKQSLNLSVYNALASRNILFLYTSYSAETGLEQRESVMKSVIPSLSYSIEF